MERRIARIAAAAHGVVTRQELLRVGISGDEISWRLSTGALWREYRGVYRVGHRAPSQEARYMAAVRACGPSAVLSHRAAAHLVELVKVAPAEPEVIATVMRTVPGVRTHRVRLLPRWELTIWRGIPVTSVARTLVDVASVLDGDELVRAVHEADVRYGTTPDQVERVLARRPRVRGAAAIRAVLTGDVRVTLSKLEARFLKLLREAGLPLPRTNRPAGGRRVDCRWPAHRLTVELDGYRYHRSRYAWEQDRRREREAHARGDTFRRFTYADVFEAPGAMLAELADLLPGA